MQTATLSEREIRLSASSPTSKRDFALLPPETERLWDFLVCSGVPAADDEGYEHLLATPPSLAEIQAFFVQQRNVLEIETAAEALRQRQSGN